jgi:hypothetical protein
LTATRRQRWTRLFEPPQLEPGVYYSYKVSASWMQSGKVVSDVRTASVVGGQVTVVDFTRPSVEALPAPLPAKDKD